MHLMRRSHSIVLTTLLIFSLILGACGDDDGATPTSEGAQPTPATQEQGPTPTTSSSSDEVISADQERIDISTDEARTAELVDGLNGFALDFYQFVAEEDDGNLIYSPYSIALAFSMVYAGARGNTEAQIADVLGFLPQEHHHPAVNALDLYLASLGEDEPTSGAEQQGEAFRLAIANAVWGQRDFPFEEAFLETLASHYGAGMRVVDFIADAEAARQAVNAWVEERTEGRIRNAVPEGVITGRTRLVLANAIYFYAAWLFPFDESATEDGPFTLLDGSEVTVPLMHHRAARVPYAEGDGYQAAVLPYTGQNVDMVVILPESGRFGEIEAGLNTNFVDDVRAAAETHDVELTMPRFDFESDFDLTKILPEMGMPDPFGPADFSGIAQADLSISAAIHKATIAVDEKGTEATAATIIAIEESAMPPAELTIDRPFIFAIVERETGTILFLGRVTNPAG